MRSLLFAGAVIDQTNTYGSTALMRATWNFRLTEILVEVGANVNILNNYRISALHHASQRNNADVLELLLKRGADIDEVNDDGWTPLHFACLYLHTAAPAVVESLLRHNADIDIEDYNGRTALQCAMFEPTSPNRLAVLQLMATCAQTRLEASSADWIRIAQNERRRPQNP